MNAAIVCLVGLGVFALGYRFYSRHLARRVFELRDDEPVPSRELEDGIDYVPTKRHVLFGHHFASIAGAAPIIGPAIAVVWGWVPALLWIVVGSVFMGAVHDFSTLVMSIRHKGRSVGAIISEVIGPRTQVLFLLVIFFLVMLVIAVFAQAIAGLFIRQPGAVIPVNFQIVVAVLIGYFCTKRGLGLLWPSIAALLALYAMVAVGVKVPVSIDALPFVAEDQAQTAWVVALLAYTFVASVLPVWLLLQPRDYINGHQLLVGLALMITGIMVAQPQIVAPAFSAAPDDAPSWFPFLFVTIACGAISGFHGLVSSGTTSKQISRATDARAIGYGGMLGEGTLALLATLAVSAGLATSADAWGAHYHSFEAAAAGGVANFVEGAATFLVALGLPSSPAEVLITILVVSFAATSLDTGVRIQRYILHELGKLYRIAPLENRYVASFIAVSLPLVLVLAGQASELWPLFGSSNQLLAGLSLTVVSVWLYRSGRPWIYAAVPMVIVIAVAMLAMGLNLASYLGDGNTTLAVAGSAIFALQAWVVIEASLVVRRLGPGAPPAPPPAP